MEMQKDWRGYEQRRLPPALSHGKTRIVLYPGGAILLDGAGISDLPNGNVRTKAKRTARN
ncbi:hypothetical protein [Paracoccus sp. (in: a-proteobacteria)]|uniref:hypothetical protein n=1 Tax=Paracoccus sp. TaxID=267 RepID=UPI0035B1EF8C